MAFPTSVEADEYFVKAYNNLSTTLSQVCGISDTTVYVASTTNFPSSGWIAIEDELRSYTGKTSGSFTGCTPGADDTTAAEHAAGKAVSLVLPAIAWNRLVTELQAVMTKLGTGATLDADTLDGFEGAALAANDIMIMANGFIIDGSSCELVETDGTADKLYSKHLAVAKTEWFDVPKFRVPDNYDGGDIDITVAFRSAAASKKHSLGIRVASVATGEPHNPDTAAAYQLYDEETSDATIGDVTLKTVTVTQANHLMVAGEIWHCKFVVEDDAGADADDVLIDFVRISWNKG